MAGFFTFAFVFFVSNLKVDPECFSSLSSDRFKSVMEIHGITCRFHVCCSSHASSHIANRLLRSLALRSDRFFSDCCSRFTVRVSFLPLGDVLKMTPLPLGVFFCSADVVAVKNEWRSCLWADVSVWGRPDEQPT